MLQLCAATTINIKIIGLTNSKLFLISNHLIITCRQYNSIIFCYWVVVINLIVQPAYVFFESSSFLANFSLQITYFAVSFVNELIIWSLIFILGFSLIWIDKAIVLSFLPSITSETRNKDVKSLKP